MKPRHHPGDEWLVSYAAGTLDEAYSLLVASHLTYCGVCREKVRAAEDVGGLLLEQQTPTDLDLGSLDRVLARLDDDVAVPAVRDIRIQTEAERAHLPLPLVEFIGGDLNSLSWRSLGRGVKAVRLDAHGREDSRLWLLRAPPGMRLAEHSHRGTELVLVMHGCLHDGSEIFVPGDVDEKGDDHWHAPVVGDGEECICLVVTDAPIRFKGLVARLLQPLIGL